MHVYNDFKNFDAEYFCDVEYQIFYLNSNKKKRFLWCQIPIFFNFYLFLFFFFGNLKKKERFLWCPISIFGRDTYSMICYEEFENPCTFVLKLMQHVSPTGKKKREGGGKKTVYLFTTVKRQKTPNS